MHKAEYLALWAAGLVSLSTISARGPTLVIEMINMSKERISRVVG